MAKRIRSTAKFSCIYLLGLLWVLPLGLEAQSARGSDAAAVLRQARADIESLCTEKMAGRGYTAQGHKHAARFLAQRFREAGLAPLSEMERYTGAEAPPVKNADTEAYFQPFRFSVNLVEDARLKLEGYELQLGTDYMPTAFTPTGQAEDLPLIDVGYGTPTELENLTRAGRLPSSGFVAVIKSGTPPEDIRYLISPQGDDTTDLKDDIFKVMVAELNGAEATVLRVPELTHRFYPQPVPTAPAFKVVDSVWQKHFPESGTLPRVEQLSTTAGLQEIQTQNVAAVRPGEVDTAVLFVAHYDHLGKVGSAIFHGANDNASGTAMLLSLADYYGKTPELSNTPYHLIFLAVSGEEAGLHGSSHYALTNPLFPLKQTKVVFDFDLFGYGEDGFACVACNDYPGWAALLKQQNQALANPLPIEERANRPISDHYHFTTRGVPGFFFYLKGGKPFYHDVEDVPRALSLAGFEAFRQLMINTVAGLPR